MSPLNKYIRLLIMITFVSGCSHSKVNTNSYKLPNACIDHTDHYQTTPHLTTITSLNSKATLYRPITAPKGMIEEDFNSDKYTDYIFIESLTTKNHIKARLVFCISNSHHYLRKLPKFPIHINTKPDFQSIYQRIEWKNKQLVLSTFKSEHNWGSDNDIKYYRYDKKQQDFILVSQKLISSSGDGLRSDTYDFYNFDKHSYKTESQCGRLEEACINTKIKGKLVLPKQRTSLFNPLTKPYLQKIPQT